ncbi:MAG: ROK family protein [Clostridiales bacterium]|nr:ROK family protein [Clostridiales bacterium]
MLLGALEAGGTKMVMGIADEQGRILRSSSCPTRLPDETTEDILDFFEGEKLDALGIATFGPADLNPASPTYGSITNTPKLAWRDFPLLRRLQERLKVPVAIDTDVNGAVLAEVRMGAARGLRNCLYMTVGTGIGGGLMSEGQLVHGLIHPEWGHVIVARHPEDPLTRGICPFHEHCVEGYASGPSIQARWATPAQELPRDHRAWEIEAWYLAQVCITAMMAVSPERIILGGGVMNNTDLFDMIRKNVTMLLGGYLRSPALQDMDSYIVPPALYPDSGLVGAALLAADAISK